MRILHVLHHSEPHLDGYGVRSKSILEFQRQLNLQPVVATSAHHEIEVNRQSVDTPRSETLSDVTFYRTPLPAGRVGRALLATPFAREQTMMRALSTTLETVLEQHPVDLIHAHSPVLCGLPALRAARRRGLPLVYEVRAFWEDAMLASTPTHYEALKYRYSRSLETRVLREANAVVAISDHMLNDIEARGVPRQRLHKVANGVDTDQFTPAPKDAELATRLRVNSHPLIGFIGSFFHFEGLEYLIRAMPAILAKVPEARLVLVGTGEAAESIGQLIHSLQLDEVVLQTGRVPHAEVMKYYSIMDVMVYPRRSERVTELVTPLKPLEAMAVGKAVVGSDVGGIRELLDDGRAGLLFKPGDPLDLAKMVVRLLTDKTGRDQLSHAARQYVLERRRWHVLVQGYLPIYSQVCA